MEEIELQENFKISFENNKFVVNPTNEDSIYDLSCDDLIANINTKSLTDCIDQNNENNSIEVSENNPYFEGNMKFKLLLKDIANSMTELPPLVSKDSSLSTDLQTIKENDVQNEVKLDSECTELTDVILDEKDSNLENQKEEPGTSIPSTSNDFEKFMECVGNEPKPVYKCRICNKVFHLIRQATKHIVSHSKTRKNCTFSCLESNQAFSSHSIASDRCAKDESNEICHDICDTGFNNSPARSSNIKLRVRKSKVYGSSFRVENAQKECLKLKLYSCKICHKTFKTKGYEKLHLITHTNKFMHSCSKCGQTFRFVSGLTRHCRQAHKDEAHTILEKSLPHQNRNKRTNKVVKKSISYSTKTISQLLDTSEKGKKIKCEPNQNLAANKLKRKRGLQPFRSCTNLSAIAIKKEKMEQTFVQCKICFDEFDEDSVLKLHMKQNHDVNKDNLPDFDIFIERGNKNKFVCKVCQKEFVHKQTAKEHIAVHTNDRNYKCSLCPEAFISRHSRFQHRFSHFYQVKYSCYICNKLFSDKGFRDIFHMTTHSKSGLYTCHMCDKTLKNPNDYDQHISKHSGNKPHKCAICQKKFLQIGDLKIHVLVHSWNKPVFECSICEESFTTKRNCRQHLCTNHDTKC